ncbi:HDOD domain-containing protein [Hydrogenimonas sp.]|jgi:HD-like signal output (HDOD) protein|uniref:HDOD domain-containing protein n=1 Tax=Hydrogenimonas sp. TaxID=2231112 RepID=UPI002611C72A|nr:HDOD domain-containing protein [Hydrogenimonas sp.]
MINSQLVQRISSLPPLPKTVTEIEKAYENPNVTVKTVAAIVEQDPMVVADLLKLLNSAFYGLRKEITSVEQAVSLLGMKSVKDLVINLSVRNMLRTNLTPYGITSEEFAKISQFQSMLAERWMRAVNPAKVERIRLLALLQEIGKIVISDELLREGEDATFKAELDAGWDIRETERNYIDATTAEVSAAMLRHWEFDDYVADLIQWADMPNQADGDSKEEAWVLRIASEAVSVRAPLSEKNQKRAVNFALKAGLPEEPLQEALTELTERWNA